LKFFFPYNTVWGSTEWWWWWWWFDVFFGICAYSEYINITLIIWYSRRTRLFNPGSCRLCV
jgi:hypothetical protein